MAAVERYSTGITITIVIGMFMALAGSAVDGFVGGALQGAGLALIVLGVYALGARWRGARAHTDAADSQQWWLPSEDEKR